MPDCQEKRRWSIEFGDCTLIASAMFGIFNGSGAGNDIYLPFLLSHFIFAYDSCT